MKRVFQFTATFLTCRIHVTKCNIQCINAIYLKILEDYYVAYTWQVPRHKKYSILFNEPCSCKNRIYFSSDMRYSCWEGSVFIVCRSLRINSFLKELFHLFNMNELCTLLNRSFPSFLQRVLPKVIPSARREIHIISDRT